MKLTETTKRYIDSLSYYELLSHWRLAPVNDDWLKGETGKYWEKQISKRQDKDPYYYYRYD